MPRKYTPEEAKIAFWEKIDKSGGDDACWKWTAGTTNAGYGAVMWHGKMCRAHRIAYLLTNGDPGEMHVLHSCDNPPCCNPAHLWLGTDADNVADKMRKGRNTPPPRRYGEDHGQCKLSDKQVEEIRARYAAGGIYLRELAKMYGVGTSQIWRIVRRESR